MTVFIKWLAHAGFQIKAKEMVIYIDLTNYDEILEKTDLILVTHSHSDHFDPFIIRKVSKENTVAIAPKDCSLKIGGTVKILEPGKEITVNTIGIRATEAYNIRRFSSPGKPYHPRGLGVGYLITVDGTTIYHAGDTGFISEMRELRHVDLALLPVGGTYTMDTAEAAEAAMAIDPKTAIPMHRLDKNPEDFRKKVEANSRIKVVLLRENQEYHLA
jgi:L-ascorbate metabolism protein UlaG (beta-lactamase superfamily)